MAIARLVLASNNAGKLREFRRLLSPLGIDVVAQAELGIAEADEPHATFVENALEKARHASARGETARAGRRFGRLRVDALDGAPGVQSARYAGEPRSDARNNAKLIAALAGVADRRAHYACVLALVRHAGDPEPIIARGRLARHDRRRAARHRRLRLRPAFPRSRDRPDRRRAAAREEERAVAPRQGDARADRAACGQSEARDDGNAPSARIEAAPSAAALRRAAAAVACTCTFRGACASAPIATSIRTRRRATCRRIATSMHC